MPAISVVMSAYNAEKYIGETIQSVIKQTFTDFEFIIIDDGSTDNTKLIIDQFKDQRIKYHHFQNSGLAVSLNRGLKLAKGKYIARIDADDICYPNRLELQYSFMERNPDYVVCGSNLDVIDESGNYIYTFSLPSDDTDIRKKMFTENCFAHPSTFFRKKDAIEIGGYYEPIKQYFEDYMFFFHLIKLGKAYNFKTPLIRYRLSPGSISSRNRNRKYKKLVQNVVHRGYITKKEKEYLFSFRTKKTKPKIKLSNHYLLLSRMILLHQGNLKLSMKYYIRAVKINPMNISIFPSTIYLILILIKRIIR